MSNTTKIGPVLTGREAKSADEYIEGEWILPPKYESTTQKGLYFWAEDIDDGRNWSALRIGPVFWMVVSQANGFPATEAFDDQLANFADADAIAQKLAKGEDVGGHF